MPAGQLHPSEARDVTGVTIRQLTSHRAHSHHLYFTNSGLWDSGRRLLMSSHRGNAVNLYSIELAGGEITQVTDLPSSAEPDFQAAYLNPVRDEVYFRMADKLLAVDLHSHAIRELFTVPAGFTPGSLSCTADGTRVCMAVCEDLSDRIAMDMGNGYIGFAEYSAARPTSRIVGVDPAGGPAEVLHEEDRWITHVNCSTAIANLLTFCHEGPWHTIDQRMWVLDVETRRTWALRPQEPDEAIGHEYWFADGQRVGYHGHRDGVARFGYIRPDNTDHREWDFPHGSFHFHSVDENLIVGDGLKADPRMFLWRREGDGYGPTRMLLTHRCSFHCQILHVHPRMFVGPDGGIRIVYTSDRDGYGNVYMLDVPPIDDLPLGDLPLEV